MGKHEKRILCTNLFDRSDSRGILVLLLGVFCRGCLFLQHQTDGAKNASNGDSLIKMAGARYGLQRRELTPQRERRKDQLDRIHSRASRILEKQNLLQMSQVFFGVAHSSFARFAFQGFYMRDHGTRQRYRLSSRPVVARVNQEPKRYAEDAQAMTQTFNKFRSRRSEAALPRQRCSQSDHDTLRSRRSEARPR